MREPENLRRTHPISIIFYLYRFLYLLVIPLIRGIAVAFRGGLLDWLSGAWLDLIILALIFTLAHQKWLRFKYDLDNSMLYYTFGIFVHQQGVIPLARVCTLATQQHFWLRPLRVVKVRVDTIVGSKGQADLELYLHKAEAERFLLLHRRSAQDAGEPVIAEARPRLSELLFLSLFTSNSLIGIVFISTFISQAGQLFGRYLADLLTYYFGELARHLTNGLAPLMAIFTIIFQIPPIATGIALVLLGGWLIAFTLNLLQTKNLHVRRTPCSLLVSGGLLTKKEYSIPIGQIQFIDVRQSLLTRLIKLYSVFLNATGMDKERSDISAIIPFSTKSRCHKQLTELLPEYSPTPRILKPNAGAIMKFIIMPLWPCVLIPLATLLGMRLLPMWEGIIRFCGLMLTLPSLWWLGVRLLDFLSSGISRAGDYFTLRYSELYYLHTVVFTADKISMVNIRQSILQRGDAKCDLVVSTRAEGSSTHHIRNLGWDDTVALFGAADDDPFVLKPSLWDKLTAPFQKKPASRN